MVLGERLRKEITDRLGTFRDHPLSKRIRQMGTMLRESLLQPLDTKGAEEPSLNLTQLVDVTPSKLRLYASLLEQDPSYQSIQQSLSGNIPLSHFNRLLESRARRVHAILANPNSSNL